MKETGRRFERELIRLGMKAQEIADKLGVSKQIVSHWAHGNSEIQGYDLARLHALGIDTEFVATGTRSPPMERAGKFSPRHFMPVLKLNQILLICKGKLDISQLERTVPALGPCSDRSFAFDVFDAAMLPNLKPGTTMVAVDPEIVPRENSGVLVALLASDDLLLRRLGYVPINADLRQRAGKTLDPPFTLIADNPEWPATERQVRSVDKPVFAGTVFQIALRDP